MPAANYTDESRESVLWNSTELVTPEDLNNMQRLAERRMIDYVFRSTMLEAGDFELASAFDPWLRPVGSALSIAPTSPSSMAVAVQPGAALWRSGADPGQPDPLWQLHQLPAARVITVDPSDPTNPRIDILSAKVEYDALDTASADAELRVAKTTGGNVISQTHDKRRRTLLTITYTPGTPAVSPVAPATPAGQVKFCEIRVDAAASTIGFSRIDDHRTPAGMSRVVRLGTQAFFTNWPTVGSTGNPRALTSTAVSQVAYYLLDPGGQGMSAPRLAAAPPPAVQTDPSETMGTRHMRLRRLAIQYGTAMGAIETMVGVVGSAGGTLESFTPVGAISSWRAFDASIPQWVDMDSASSRNPRGWGQQPNDVPGLQLRLTSSASGNVISAIMADFWGV